jgi:RNA-binding protein YlmH
MIGFSPDRTAPADGDFPIDALRADYNAKFSSGVSHRDMLGSLMSLGVGRAKTGDIVVGAGFAVIYLSRSVSEYALLNMEKAGRTSLKLSRFAEPAPEAAGDGREIVITAQSPRMDAILSRAFRMPRSKAAELIKAGNVLINWRETAKLSKNAAVGDVITLRGYGRVRIDGISDAAKKGGVRLNVTVFD